MTSTMLWANGISISKIGMAYKWRISVTWFLLIFEAALGLAFPLAIGFCVDQLMQGNQQGLYVLGGVIAAAAIVGSFRRFYDTRVYSAIYVELGDGLVAHETGKGAPVSKIAARTSLLRELVEFFENSAPELIASIIMFFGTLIVVATIDVGVMLICFVSSVLVIAVYAVSAKRIFTLNKGQNNELERHVQVLDARDGRKTHRHLKRLMRWNIRLSDLETINYGFVWVILGSMLIGSVYLIVVNPAISAGLKITSIMYVFDYIEVVVGLPLFFQEVVRLKEITQRLSERAKPKTGAVRKS